MEEDAFVSNLADDDDVIQVPATCACEGGSELNEHAAPIVFRRHDEHGVRREDGVEVVRSQPSGDCRPRCVVLDERDVVTPTPVQREFMSGRDNGGLHRLNGLDVGEWAGHVDLHVVKISPATDIGVRVPLPWLAHATAATNAGTPDLPLMV